MKISSPLRYPGGKSSMASLLGQILTINGLGDRAIAEPFAGGAGASLTLLYREETKKIFINDADPAIHDFWWTLTNRIQPFLKTLSSKRVSMAEWKRQRDTYRLQNKVSRLRRGFAAFYLNRCNRSGIIMNGGPIGGIEQKGDWKIGARFNKAALTKRCEKVAEFSDRIQVSCIDGIKFIKGLNAEQTLFFIDPPYFDKGKTLYLNSLNEQYHVSLGACLKSMKKSAWVLTYDDCPEIRKIYQGWANIRAFSLRYAASEKRNGNEILITPKWMALPESQRSAAIGW